jgi:hypothetical protein
MTLMFVGIAEQDVTIEAGITICYDFDLHALTGRISR